MDRIDRADYQAGRTLESAGRDPQKARAYSPTRPRPVFWTGVALDRDCDDIAPVLWDGTCLE
jgi:hypothetical protein